MLTHLSLWNTIQSCLLPAPQPDSEIAAGGTIVEYASRTLCTPPLWLAFAWCSYHRPDRLSSSVNMTQDTTSSHQKTILILGGSYGGLSTAHYVLKHVVPALPENASYEVALVAASSQVLCRPACPRALISDDMFPQAKLFVSIAKVFEQYPKDSFTFIQGTASALNHTDRNVTVRFADGNTDKLDYHALVIATGASTPSPLLSLNEDEERLRTDWAAFRKALPAAKSILVAGGGPTGIETAGELGEYLNGRARYFSSKLASPKVSITVVTSGSRILPALRPVIAEKAEDYLAKVGVVVMKNKTVKTVAPTSAGTTDLTTKATIALDDGTTLDADLYVPAFGTRPNTAFVDKSLLCSDGRLDTNAASLRVDKAGPRVYAIGDVASYARPAVHLILEAVPILCANIKRDLLLAATNQESAAAAERVFKEDTRETHLVPIGKTKGVGAAMGWRLPSLLVWLIKGRDYWLWTTGDLWSGKQWAKAS